MATPHQHHFHQLLRRYLSGKANEKEKEFLENFYDTFGEEEDHITDANEKDYAALKKEMKHNISREISPRSTNGLRWIWYSVAASILILLSLVIFNNRKGAEETQLSKKESVVQPGSEKAVLELADGEKILLNEVGHGKIALENGAEIYKDEEGKIVYRIAGKSTATGTAKNTISTPRGGEFRVLLADGTQVWLNAASSLTFPSAFASGDRVVNLLGEAYFEVSKDPDRPFKVSSGKHLIEVLGTHFNVSAYLDESAIKTTLVEGSVKVSSEGQSKLIQPGQQSVFRKNDGELKVRNVNIESETAWKNGIFSFENNNIRYILRQISRWYDIEVIYEEAIPDDEYIGEISRKTSLQEVLQILELNNLTFRLNGKTLYVSSSKTDR